jgi:hypothetical protein
MIHIYSIFFLTEGDIDQPAKGTAVVKYSLLPGDSEPDREDTTPTTVSGLGQGKNISIIQAHLQDKASALNSSSELSLPVDSGQIYAHQQGVTCKH